MGMKLKHCDRGPYAICGQQTFRIPRKGQSSKLRSCLMCQNEWDLKKKILATWFFHLNCSFFYFLSWMFDLSEKTRKKVKEIVHVLYTM
jgi:hypothetical protein